MHLEVEHAVNVALTYCALHNFLLIKENVSSESPELTSNEPQIDSDISFTTLLYAGSGHEVPRNTNVSTACSGWYIL